MPSFRKDYDTRLPGIATAIDNMPGSLDSLAPGLNKAKLKRFFKRFSLLLGRLDKSGAKEPQYLFYGGQMLPAYLITLVDQAVSYMPNGAAYFAQNSFHALIEIQDRLEKAVGTDLDQLKNMAPSIAADLSTSVQQADNLLADLHSRIDEASKAEEEITRHKKAAEENRESIEAAAQKAQEARRTIESLVNPDGRSKTSLESLARQARERVSEIDDLKQKSSALSVEAENSKASVDNIRTNLLDVENELTSLKIKAEEVLSLSSQAGLAASYKQEGDSLTFKGYVYTGILYTSAIATLVIAMLYVLPGLETAIRIGREASVGQALAAAILRATVLAPLVYVIYFTTKRVSALETLRMDYAEKAAASLAYSGYRDQMTNDDDLLRQLKGSLLSKFHEHPERLLRSGATSSSAKVRTPDFEAETRINMPPTKERLADSNADE